MSSHTLDQTQKYCSMHTWPMQSTSTHCHRDEQEDTVISVCTQKYTVRAHTHLHTLPPCADTLFGAAMSRVKWRANIPGCHYSQSSDRLIAGLCVCVCVRACVWEHVFLSVSTLEICVFSCIWLGMSLRMFLGEFIDIRSLCYVCVKSWRNTHSESHTSI